MPDDGVSLLLVTHLTTSFNHVLKKSLEACLKTTEVLRGETLENHDRSRTVQTYNGLCLGRQRKADRCNKKLIVNFGMETFLM